jgi:hypothetical protein
MSQIAWTGSSVVITAGRRDGNLYYWSQQSDTATWHQEVVAIGNYNEPSIAWTGSSAVIAASGFDGTLSGLWPLKQHSRRRLSSC